MYNTPHPRNGYMYYSNAPELTAQVTPKGHRTPTVTPASARMVSVSV